MSAQALRILCGAAPIEQLKSGDGRADSHTTRSLLAATVVYGSALLQEPLCHGRLVPFYREV